MSLSFPVLHDVHRSQDWSVSPVHELSLQHMKSANPFYGGGRCPMGSPSYPTCSPEEAAPGVPSQPGRRRSCKPHPCSRYLGNSLWSACLHIQTHTDIRETQKYKCRCDLCWGRKVLWVEAAIVWAWSGTQGCCLSVFSTLSQQKTPQGTKLTPVTHHNAVQPPCVSLAETRL